jgi:amino acid adenylation domain-containing protein
MDQELRRKASEKYWMDKLKSMKYEELRTMSIHTGGKKNSGSFQYFLPVETEQLLDKVSRSNDKSKFVLLLATTQILFYKYSCGKNLLIGTNNYLADRTASTSSAVFLKTEISSDASVIDVINSIQAELATIHAYGNVDVENVLKKLCQLNQVDEMSIFQMGLVYNQEQPVSNLLGKASRCFRVREDQEGVQIQFQWCEETAAVGDLEKFATLFGIILDQILRDVKVRISDIKWLTETEEERILLEFNRTNVELLPVESVSQLFEKQVERTPQSLALFFEQNQYTYLELNKSVNRLANYLINEFSVKANQNVVVFLSRSHFSVISMMAVLKSGACYVPINPDLPDTKIDYILNDVNPVLILTEASLKSRLENRSIPVNEIDTLVLEGHSDSNPKCTVDLNDLSYIIYTSGSTGEPKGVMQTHRTLLNLIQWDIQYSGIPAGLSQLQYSSYSFDSSLNDAYFTLSGGGQLFVVGEEVRSNFELLKQYVHQHGIEVLSLPFAALTSFFNHLDEDSLNDHSIKHIISTGEQLIISGRLTQFLLANPKIKLHNYYGPSEAHVVTASAVFFDGSETYIPIGKPISNSQIYILDKDKQPLPCGFFGDVYIGGFNLAAGYLNHELLTKEKFIWISLPKVGSVLVYVSGDIGAWQPDGSIIYAGRADNQVKIRGYRVELGEVENGLVQYPGIKQAVVIAKADEGTHMLIAYYVAETAVDEYLLRNFLKNELPEYMHPAYLIHLDKIPLTFNGKVDKRKLPEVSTFFNPLNHTPAQNDIQERLIQIWREILGKKEIGIDDNFFRLGGHSLKAMRLMAKVSQDFKVNIPLAMVFKKPTIKQLSEIIPVSEPASDGIPMLAKADYYELSHAQKRLWIMHQFGGGNAYNVPCFFRIKGNLDVSALSKAFAMLVEHYEILRTSFIQVDEVPRQRIHDVSITASLIRFFDLTDDPDQSKKLKELTENELSSVFDLANGPAVQFSIICLGGLEHILIINVHHILFDARSIDIFFERLIAYYKDIIKGEQTGIAPLPLQYKEYAHWHNEVLSGKPVEEHLAFWLKKFSYGVSTLKLKTDFERPAVKTYRGDAVHAVIDSALVENLRDIATVNGYTLFIQLLAGFKIFLSKYTRQNEIIVGLPVDGRDHDLLHDQIGFFINTLPVKSILQEDSTYISVLQALSVDVAEVLEHKLYPIDKLVEKLNLSRDGDKNPFFEVIVQLLHDEYAYPEVNNLSIELMDLGYDVSKFDLTVNFFEKRSGDVNMVMRYNSDLFTRETIGFMKDCFISTIEQVCLNPLLPVKKITLPLTNIRYNNVNEVSFDFD